MPKRRGRKSEAQTPAPAKERIYGSKKNPKGSASSEKTAKDIKLSPSIILALSKKLAEFKKKHPKAKNITLGDLKAVYRRAMGAYSKSHRPTISGGIPNTRNAWGMARVNKFLKKASGEKVKAAYVQDDDLLKMEKGGEIILGKIYSGAKVKNYLKKANYKDESFFQYIKNNDKYQLQRVDVDDLVSRDSTLSTFVSMTKDTLQKNENESEWLNKYPIVVGNTDYEDNVVLDGYHRISQAIENGEEEIIGFVKVDFNESMYSKGGATLLAPNGKPSNLTAEQWKLVRTPEFKVWFGDWENDPENASKVVDENGEPLVVFHGAKRKFYTFKKKKNVSDKNPFFKSGFWFFSDPIGESLSQEDREYFYEEGNARWMAENWVEDADGNSSSIVLECFLNVRNPIEVDSYAEFLEFVEDDKVKKSIEKRQVDGWFIHGSTTDGGVYRDDINVFDSSQIKLADGTNTTFDPTNPDIRYAKGGATKNLYKYDTYTELQKTLYSEIWSSDNVFIFKYPEISTAIIYDTGSIGSDNKKNEKNKLKEFYERVKYDLITQIVLENFGEDVALRMVDDIVNQKLVRFDVEKEKEIEDYENIISFDNANIHFLRKGDYKPKSSKNLAPNGKPSNLNDEQYKLVRTKQFKSWFGDWEKDPENSSQVVDENGEPLVLYRGDTSAAKKGFVFKTGFNRLKYVTKDRLPNQYFFYFVDKYHVANGYAVNGIEQHNSDIIYDEKKGKLWYPKVTPYFLNIRKPLDLTPRNPNFPTYKEYYNDVKGWGEDKDDVNWRYPMSYGYNLSFKLFDKLLTKTIGDYIIEDSGYWSNTEYLKKKVEWRKQDGWDAQIWSYFVEYERNKDWSLILKDIIQTMENQGYDGLVFLEDTNYLDADYEDFKNVKYDPNRWNLKPFVYAAMKPEQIKLADGSNVTFDPTNTDIRYEDGGKMKKGALVGGYEDITDEWLSKKIEIFLDKVKPIKYYFVDPETNTLVVGFDKHYSTDAAEKFYKEATSSMEFFDADSVESIYDSKTGDTMFKIKLKKEVEYKKGGEMKKDTLNQTLDTIGNVDSDPLVEGVMEKGGELSEGDKKETYAKWKDLINMSKSELQKFYNSEEGKEAGITIETAKKLGISRGRTSAKWIMKMKSTPVAKWTPEMWKWANKQISFVSRMRGNKGDLYDDKGRKTRKHTSLLIWGHNPEKYADGGETKRVSLEGYYAKGGKLLNPKGKESNLTPEEYKLVRTPEFKAWFGDWENKPKSASKVLDAWGEPLVVYHGSSGKFNFFSQRLSGINVQREGVVGFYFSNNDEVAELYTYHDDRAKYLGKKYVRPFFLNLRKILTIDVADRYGEPTLWSDKYDKLIKKAKKDGYDGVVIKNIVDVLQGFKRGKGKIDYWGDTYVVFDPKNIKLADGRNTTFDGNTDDIRYEKGGEAKTCEVIRNGVRQIDPKSIEKLTDCVMSLPQTKSMHLNKNGEYSPERKQLHKKIIYDIKKDLTCVERKEPIAILMGGSPASGKSTFLKKYRPYLLSEEILKVDADEVRSKLPEYKGWNATQTHLETKDIVNLLLSDRNIGIPCAFDLIYDGTMNSTKSYIPLINLLKSLGYKVFIVYIDKVDEATIKDRALKRYQKSGRFVPMEVIDDFFNKGTAALENLKSMVDGYMVVDGSSSDYKVIDRGGLQLPKDRKYSKIGTPIEVTEEEVVREYKEGGETEFNPDSKKLKSMITHKSGSAGGMLVGNRHSQGGIKAINKSTGQPLEMEGGEVVITRDAVSDDTKREFEGEMLTNREILSKINESGGGVSFADGGDIHECGCTGKKFNYGGKTMTDYDILKEMKSLYPRDFAKGKKEELSEHRGTFEKLRRKGLTASQAAELVVAEHLKKKPDYYKNYKEGGIINILGKKIPSMPSFLQVGEPVLTPFKGQFKYFYPIKDAVKKTISYREGGHIRGRKISDLLAYKTYIYDNFDINFSELPVKLQNALTLGKQKLVDDYLKE